MLGSFHGDTNLDGRVPRDDVAILTAKLGAASAGWADGDFNGDRLVPLGPVPPSASAISEPTTAILGQVLMIATALVAVRLRKSSASSISLP